MRRADASDAPLIADLLEPHRLRLAAWSPQFWRPARDARSLHELYLGWLVGGDGIGFIEPGHGVIVARPQDGHLLIDDFVADSSATALELVRAAATAGATRAVAAVADLPANVALRANGFTASSEWWIAPTGVTTEVGTRLDGGDPVLEILQPPPIFDPGGPVAHLAWNREVEPVAALAAAASAGCALCALEVATTDQRHATVLTADGFSPASRWYHRVEVG